MAVQLETVILRYIGLSGDTKPTLEAKDSGSMFYETDTGAEYIWGGAAWTLLIEGVARKVITFDGGTLNGIGDINGTSNPATIFTVTGTVIVRIAAVCTTNLADGGGTGTVEVGITGNTAAMIAQTTAVDIDANEIWHDATPDASIEAADTLREYIITNDADIELLCATEDITGGVLEFYCIWTPLSAGATVV